MFTGLSLLLTHMKAQASHYTKIWWFILCIIENIAIHLHVKDGRLMGVFTILKARRKVNRCFFESLGEKLEYIQFLCERRGKLRKDAHGIRSAKNLFLKRKALSSIIVSRKIYF